MSDLLFDFNQMKQFLEEKYRQFNTKDFIKTDPIQIPHLFTKKEDIEISGFLTSIIAWGNRKMIIRNAMRMLQVMDFSPYEFILQTPENQFFKITDVKHRTFNTEDFIYFLRSLKNIYQNHGGLEEVFAEGFKKDKTVKSAIAYFREVFFSLEDYPQRTLKHISDVNKGSAAKRINMFLMWMVRQDYSGVHFGLWKSIPVSELKIPLDVHTGNAARALGLLQRKQNDWKAVEEVTQNLKLFDPQDPVKYDFALFGLDLENKKKI